MLVTLDQTRPCSQLEAFLDSLADNQLTIYASDLLEQRGCDSIEALGQAVRRATEICSTMHLPLRENFKVVYRSRNGNVVQDWRLSPMAYLLMVINSDFHNDVVARAQVEMVKRALNL